MSQKRRNIELIQLAALEARGDIIATRFDTLRVKRIEHESHAARLDDLLRAAEVGNHNIRLKRQRLKHAHWIVLSAQRPKDKYVTGADDRHCLVMWPEADKLNTLLNPAPCADIATAIQFSPFADDGQRTRKGLGQRFEKFSQPFLGLDAPAKNHTQRSIGLARHARRTRRRKRKQLRRHSKTIEHALEIPTRTQNTVDDATPLVQAVIPNVLEHFQQRMCDRSVIPTVGQEVRHARQARRIGRLHSSPLIMAHSRVRAQKVMIVCGHHRAG